MEDKRSTGRMIYQGHGSNSGIWLFIGRGHLYRRGQGSKFNPTKPNVWVKCEYLIRNVYSIIDAWQADKYTKTMEAILNYVQDNFTKGNYVKKSLE